MDLSFQEHQGMSFNPTKLLNSAVANIIYSLLFGGRYEYQDEHFQQLQETIGNVFELFQNTVPVSKFNRFEIILCMSTFGKVSLSELVLSFQNPIHELTNLKLYNMCTIF